MYAPMPNALTQLDSDVNRIRCFVFALLANLLLPIAAHASVSYAFSFFDIDNGVEDFGFTLIYDDYITESAMKGIGYSVPTTLGYDINYAGSTAVGSWAFDEGTEGILYEGGFDFSSTSFLTYFDLTVDYITTPGTYEGWVLGNAPVIYTFSGSSTLTVTETVVPLPGAFGLLCFGLAAIAATRRRTRDSL